MKVSFELSPRDIKYFRDRLKAVRQGKSAHDEAKVIELTRELVEEATESEPPEFVQVRLARLEQLMLILEDDEWRITGRDRARILDALAYFVDPDDMIHDHVPGVGYLDDAIMIELITEELKHDISAYEDFCTYRKKLPKTKAEERLETRRESLQARMRRRRRQQRQARRERPRASRSSLNLW